MGDWIRDVWRDAKRIIDSSPLPEDPIHARNTLKWLLRLNPRADKNLRLAGLTHDIERAIPERKVKREDYPNYELFKKAHAENSALIVAQIMGRYKVYKEAIRDVTDLIKRHEIGGTERADLLKDADSLSFFDKNLYFYAERNSLEEVIRRCIWGYKRISEERRFLVREILNKRSDKISRYLLSILDTFPYIP